MIYELCCVYAKNALVNHTCGRGINKKIVTPNFFVIYLILQCYAKNTLHSSPREGQKYYLENEFLTSKGQTISE